MTCLQFIGLATMAFPLFWLLVQYARDYGMPAAVRLISWTIGCIACGFMGAILVRFGG